MHYQSLLQPKKSFATHNSCPYQSIYSFPNSQHAENHKYHDKAKFPGTVTSHPMPPCRILCSVHPCITSPFLLWAHYKLVFVSHFYTQTTELQIFTTGEETTPNIRPHHGLAGHWAWPFMSRSSRLVLQGVHLLQAQISHVKYLWHLVQFIYKWAWQPPHSGNDPTILKTIGRKLSC